MEAGRSAYTEGRKSVQQEYLNMPSEKALRTRRSLIEASFEIIREDGFEHLTLDRVAARAKVSKGALTYHFSSKRALIKALIESYAGHMDEELEKYQGLFEGEEADVLVAGYIEWFKAFETNNKGWAALGVELLSGILGDAELMEPITGWYRRLYNKIEALPANRRCAVMACVMAMEGFFYTHKFGLDLASPSFKKELWSYLTGTVAGVSAKRVKRRAVY
jgi:AcrR family transcriptional regulator